MNGDDAYFGTLLECKDELDRKINNSTVVMIMGLKINGSILTETKKWDDYFGKVINLAKSLQKANQHYRNYVIEEQKFLLEFKEKHSNNPSVNTHSSTAAVSLSTELDGFLSHFKSGLDTLATTFNPLLGLNFDAWHKKKDVDGQMKSGIGILSSLERNIPLNLKHRSSHLIEYIRENIDWVTYLVDLRDKVHHHGGLKKATDVFYDYKKKEVYPQMIIHAPGNGEPVNAFMLRTLDESIDYFRDVLILSLQIKALGDDMFIVKNNKSEFPPYQWAIRIPKTSN